MSHDVPYADNSVPLSAQDEHLPVLPHEVIAALLSTKVSVASTDTASTILVDGTFGRGGHSRQLLQRLSADDRLFALDRDPDAASVANLLADEDPRFSFVQARFSELGSLLTQRGFDGDRSDRHQSLWPQQRAAVGHADLHAVDLGVGREHRFFRLSAVGGDARR